MKKFTRKYFFLSLILLSFSQATTGNANNCGNVNLWCKPQGGQKINSPLPGEKCEKNDPFGKICGTPHKWAHNRQARSNKCAEMHPKECANNNCAWSEPYCDNP